MYVILSIMILNNIGILLFNILLSDFGLFTLLQINGCLFILKLKGVM